MVNKYYLNPNKTGGQPVQELYDTINYLTGLSEDGTASSDSIIYDNPSIFTKQVDFQQSVNFGNSVQVNNNINVTGTATVGGALSSENLTTQKVLSTKFYCPGALNYALFLPRSGVIENGDIVALNTSAGSEVYRKAEPSDVALVGVASEDFAIIGGGARADIDTFLSANEATYVPVAVSGIVYTKVIGNISKGDKITISETSGVGRKATWGEPVIGFAIENFGSNSVGKIKVKLI